MLAEIRALQPDISSYVLSKVTIRKNLIDATLDVSKPFIATYSAFVEDAERILGMKVLAIEDIIKEEPKVIRTGRSTVFRGPILMSSGVIPFVGKRMIVHRRGPTAKVHPNVWQDFAGRCDSDPITTAIRELYEELLIYRGNTIFIPEIDGMSRILFNKVENYARVVEMVKLLHKIDIASMDIEFVKTRRIPWIQRKLPDLRITVQNGAEVIDQFTYRKIYGAVVENTLELRLVREIEIPKGAELIGLEPINTKIKLMTPEELARVKTTPLLREFLRDVLL